MRQHYPKICAALLASSLIARGADSEPLPADKLISLADVGALVALSKPVLSPDGRQVAFVVSRTNTADNLYHALKDNGVTARFVVSGLDGHDLADPFHRRQAYALTLAWMDEHCASR